MRQEWCEGFGDSDCGGLITCNLCAFVGVQDYPPDWAIVNTQYGETWYSDREHGFRHPCVPFNISTIAKERRGDR